MSCSFSTSVAARTMSRRPASPGVARLLELLEVERVVDVGDHDLVRVAQHRVLVHQVALEDRDVRPRHQLVELVVGDLAHAEVRVGDVAALDGRDELDVVLAAQRARDLPRPDRGAGHLGRQRVAGRDEDPAPFGEHVLDPERLDDRIEARRRTAGSPMFGWNGSRNSRMISWSLRRRASWRSRRVSASPSICSTSASIAYGRGQRLLRDADLRLLLGAAPPLQVQRVGVGAAEGHAPPDRQHQRGRQHPAQVLVVVVLEDREQRVALEEVVLPPRAEAPHRLVVTVVHERLGYVAHAVAEQPEPPAEVHVLEEHEVARRRSRRPARTRRSGITIAAPDANSTSVARSGIDESGSADVELEAVAVERHRRVDEVDGAALPVEHLAGDARDRRVGVQRVDRGPEPAPGPGARRCSGTRRTGRSPGRHRGCSHPRTRCSRSSATHLARPGTAP